MSLDSASALTSAAGPVTAGRELPLLPAFILVRKDGIHVDPAAITAEPEFRLFVERLFLAGFRFSGLRYPLFQRLIHEWAPAPNAAAERLADAIVAFEPARRELYKGVKVTPGGEKAEYFFEPVVMATMTRTPLYGEAGEDGTAPVVGWDERRDMTPTELDADEFVVDLWDKGVHYGIDFDRVRQLIAGKETGRFEIARMLDPERGSDAGIQEVFADLHRDNSPKRLASGRLDLRQFNNRFPQIGKGVAVFKKTPRSFGKPGFTVAGKVVEAADKPKDFDLLSLSGPGTRVEKRADGEYIVAAMDGFLALDGKTNLVSVTEKVINTDGVSLRTTGDLNLSGDEFETHGDVQERRMVEGKHMTFHGDVYGAILSRGGDILVDGNIVKGKAASPGGSIVVKGRASHADLRAVDGAVEVALAEGCTIVASRVRIERAYSCEIIAEQVEANHLEGCAVAASSLHIKTSHNRRDSETAVSVLIPDFSDYRMREKKLSDELEKLRQTQCTISGQLGQLRGQPELTRFIALDMKLKKGEIKLNAQQSEQAHKAAQRFMPAIQKIRLLAGELEKIKQQAGLKETELAETARQREAAAAAVGCHIDQVTGETVVRTLPLLALEPALSDPQIAALQGRLRGAGDNQTRLYSGSEGSFAWRYVEAEA